MIMPESRVRLLTDCTHLLIDELEPVARHLGLDAEYREVVSRDMVGLDVITRYMTELRGISVNEIAQVMAEAEPYEGVQQSVMVLKAATGCEVIVISDDALLAVPENQAVIREKLPIDRFYTTAVPEVRNGVYTGEVGWWNSKPGIAESLYSPDIRYITLLQGSNDMPLQKWGIGRANVRTGVINSHDEDMKGMADYYRGTHSEMLGMAREMVKDMLRRAH